MSGRLQVDNLAVSALAWNPASSTVALGTLHGCVELQEAFLKRVSYGACFEITCSTGSQATVRNLQTGRLSVGGSHPLPPASRFDAVNIMPRVRPSHALTTAGHTLHMRSAHGALEKVDIYRERFVVAKTPGSLLLADMDAARSSEVPWAHSGRERFSFEHPQVPDRGACMRHPSSVLCTLPCKAVQKLHSTWMTMHAGVRHLGWRQAASGGIRGQRLPGRSASPPQGAAAAAPEGAAGRQPGLRSSLPAGDAA